MVHQTNTDNIYPEGSLITALEDPLVKIKILKYRQRIYYCEVVGEDDRKKRVYFERELIPPAHQ